MVEKSGSEATQYWLPGISFLKRWQGGGGSFWLQLRVALSVSPYVPLGFWCPVCVCELSFSATPWTVAHQAPMSMELLRQKYWSGLPFPSPGDLPDPGIELSSPASPSLTSGFFIPELLGKHLKSYFCPFLNSLLSSTQALTTLYYLTSSASSLLFGLDFLQFYL